MTPSPLDRPPREWFSGIPAWLWAAIAAPRLVLFGLALADPQRCLRADSLGYLALAGNLIHHAAFSIDPAHYFIAQTFRTPGYPIFLIPFVALFGHPVLPIALAQCILGGLTAALAWRWFEHLGGRRGAILGVLALALDPVILFHTPILLTETLFQFLLVLAVTEMWAARPHTPSASGKSPTARGGLESSAISSVDSTATSAAQVNSMMLRAAADGLLWGWSALVRPISLYLPPFLCWWWCRDKKAVAVFLLAAYCIPTAWVIRNGLRTGVYEFSSIGGHDLLRYPAAGVESLRTGRPWTQLDPELREQVDREHPSGYANDSEMGRSYGQAASRILKAHPLLLARYCARGAVKILSGTGVEMVLEWTQSKKMLPSEGDFRPQVTGQGTIALLRQHPGLIPLQTVYMMALGVLYILAAAGLLRLYRGARIAEAAMLLLCLSYFLGLSSSQGYYRYRIPLIPFLAAGASASMSRKKS